MRIDKQILICYPYYRRLYVSSDIHKIRRYYYDEKANVVFLGTINSAASVCPFSFNATAGTNANISADRVIQLEYDESEEPVEN